jgi:hypothetical protein
VDPEARAALPALQRRPETSGTGPRRHVDVVAEGRPGEERLAAEGVAPRSGRVDRLAASR